MANEEETISVCHLYPELILSEIGIGINPDDIRYSHLTSSHVINPAGQIIPIFWDKNVEIGKNNGIYSVGELSEGYTISENRSKYLHFSTLVN